MEKKIEQKFYTNITWMVASLMQQLTDTGSRKIALLIGERAERETLLDFTAVLALRGPVCILDAGNRFDPYRVTRAIRRQTVQLDQALGRIYVARAFTCYQVITLLQKTPATPMPHLVFDLLATFSDQAVSYAESTRLLQIACRRNCCVCDARRRSSSAPGRSRKEGRDRMLRLLKARPISSSSQIPKPPPPWRDCYEEPTAPSALLPK